MALLASEWCGREGNRSVFNPLFYSTFTKASLELPNNQTDAELMRRTPKVTIPSPSPPVRPHHHSGDQETRLTSEVVTAAVRVVVHCKMSF